MDSSVEHRASVPASLRALYEPVATELEAVERLLERELSSDNPFVNRLAQHGFRLGGKRLRPALVLLTAHACGGVRPEHVPLAATTELIHTATLIHDDVVDEATLRRHLDTVNARWDNEASVLLGDYLLARAICLIGSLGDNFACRAIGESARRVCEGELRQIENRGNFELAEEDYFDIIGGKTAALTACCCRLGAHYAGAEPAVCDAMTRYGHDLGLAFQIADDVLDLVGDQAVVGKSLGTDLVKQKATLPLIHALRSADSKQREELKSLLAEPDGQSRETLRPWLERFDAIAYARQRSREFTTRAGEQLAVLHSTPAARSLLGLTDFVVNRHQ